MKGIFFFLFLACFGTAYAEQLKVATFAKQAILVNADTGAVLYEKKSEDLAYPASLTKIATCLYALKIYQKDLDEPIVCPDHCLIRLSKSIKASRGYQDPPYFLEPDGSHYLMKSGEILSFRELLYGLMIASGNDAANVLAHHIGGNIPEFVNGMNQYLKEIGCKNTHLVNPHGLHHPAHYSTAKDIALIAIEGLKVSLIRTIMGTKQHKRLQTNLQCSKMIENKNLLIQPGKFFYPQAIGMKTGYHSDAGYTYVGVAKEGGRTLIAVLLGCEGSYYQCFQDAIHLFDAAFEEEKKERRLFNKEDNLFCRRIQGGKQPLKAILTDNVTISYYPAEEREFTIELNWKHIRPSIPKGSVVGTIRVLDERGKEMHVSPLIAKESVSPTLLCTISGFFFPKHGWAKHFQMMIWIGIGLVGGGLGWLVFWIQQGKQGGKMGKG